MLSKILESFSSPRDDCRIMMRWWWFGPAVTESGIKKQLELMKNTGIGGVELAVIYPLCLDNEIDGISNGRYMSEEFLSSVAFAAKTAKELEMRFDLTLCSGWPFGGPHIPLEMSARKLRIEEIKISKGEKSIPLPELDNGEIFLKAFSEGQELCIENNSISLPEAFQNEKNAELLISSFTNQKVKRAALSAEGHVLDHYYKEALDIHLKEVGQKFIDAIGSENIHAVFTDSLEVFESSWTKNIFEEFKKRRGYDLEKHLQYLTGEETEMSKNIRHDYGQTLTEMLNDNFLSPLQNFAHKNNVLSRVQAYGVPPAALNSYKFVDLPEGEATSTGISSVCRRADWTELTPNRIASSASKHYGRGVTSAETWTFLHSPPYAATLLDMKAEADQFFLQGINQIIGHGWPYSPDEAGNPGWIFYAAGNFNQTNSLYPAMDSLSEYLQKASSLLRQGKTVADIGIYLPNHDTWANYSIKTSRKNFLHAKAIREHIGYELLPELLKMGYNFELIDDDILHQISENKHEGYPIILLPGIERMPLASVKALKKCNKVIAYKRIPDKAPGMIENEKDSDTVKDLSKKIFNGTTFIESASELKKLKKIITPDVELNQNELAIGYVHRTLEKSDIYFFANTSNRPLSFSPNFTIKRQNALKLDPMTGNVSKQTEFIELAPFETVFVMMTDDAPEKMQTPNFANRKQIDISKDWDVEFSGLSIKLEMKNLISWTEIEKLKNYSGEAVYSKNFELPETPVDSRVMVSLGEAFPLKPYFTKENEINKGFIAFADTPVKDAATVFVNGKKVGTLFAPPYKTDISKFLKTGENLIEIKVYNRLTNKLSGESLPDYSALNEKYGQRFDCIQDFDALKPFESGLTGKIEIFIEN